MVYLLLKVHYQNNFFQTENMATLFRASTLATMLMERFMKLTAMDYLLSVLRKPIHDITTSTESCEVCAVTINRIMYYLYCQTVTINRTIYYLDCQTVTINRTMYYLYCQTVTINRIVYHQTATVNRTM